MANGPTQVGPLGVPSRSRCIAHHEVSRHKLAAARSGPGVKRSVRWTHGSDAWGFMFQKRCAASALVGDDGSLSDVPDRVEPSALLEEGEALEALLANLRGVISSARVSQVRLLLPDPGVPYRHPEIAARIEHETLVRLAAYQEGLAVEQLSRGEARTRLGLPTRGKFEELLTEAVVGRSVGRHWHDGRRLAMAAALANG